MLAWQVPSTPICEHLARDAKASADAAAGKKEWKEAAAAYSAALDSFPAKDDVAALLSNRSMCHLNAGSAEAALSDALAVTCSRPKWAKGWARKALALSALGQPAEALAAALEGVTLAPDDKGLAKIHAQMLAAPATAADAADAPAAAGAAPVCV